MGGLDSGFKTTSKSMRIGPLTIAPPVTLAPLEEHSNSPFRLLMKQFGAGLVSTERVGAAEVARRGRRALRLLYTSPAEWPCAAQISGSDPVEMAAAAQIVAELGFCMVDLNFECPVRRLLARGEGGAMMADPARIGRIVEQVAHAVADSRHAQDPQRAGRRARDGGRGGPAGGTGRGVGRLRSRPERGPRLRRRAGLVRFGPGQASGRDPGDRQRRHSRGGRRGANDRGLGRRRRGGRPGVPGQSVDLSADRRADAGVGPGRGPTLAERGRALLQLVEGEFHLYGVPLALRRLPRTSGYFAQWLADAAGFRQAAAKVGNLAQFRRLVKQYFR